MTVHVEAVDHNWSEAEPTRRGFGLGWPLMLFIGWLVFDVTADAALTAVVACGKFGWNDWLTARWLRKTDPVPARAAACAWFYRASAVWKIALAATVGMFLLTIVEVVAFGRKNPGREWAFIAGEAFFGFALATLLTIAGSISAWRSGQRVWVSARVHTRRRQDVWPPYGLPYGFSTRNGISTLVTTAVLTCLVPLVVLAMVVAFAIAPLRAETLVTILSIGGIFGIVVLALIVGNSVSQRVAARWPHECWTEMLNLRAD
ncbi:MAG: hypothetical protein ACREHD_06700 [Pirellulales bacterium]